MLIFLRSALYVAILVVYTPFYWVIVMLSGLLPRQTRWHIISWWPNLAT